MNVDINTISSKKLKELKAKQLDEAFIRKYPNGQYGIHLSGVGVIGSRLPKDNYRIEIYIQYKRKTSWCAFPCPVVDMENGKPRRLKYVNNSWGFVRFYTNEKDFLIACKKYNIPIELINELILYNEEFKNERGIL